MRVSQINLSGIWPRSLLLIALAFSAGSPSSSIVFGQHTAFVSAIARFEAQIAQDVAKDSIGGITAGVVVGNNVVWKRGFGWADVANRIPADGGTIYRIGSISKSFTAMLMMQLAHKGVLRLDDPVERYLPEIKNLTNVPSNARPITLRQLATHTSGLALEPKLPDAAAGPIAGWEEKILASIPTIPFVASPGEKFSYSNVGYGILGLAISRAAKRPFMELVKEFIFDPLGVENTAYIVTSAMQSYLAAGYSNEDPAKIDAEKPAREHAGRGYKVPNGGIYSNIDDLALFMQAQAEALNTRILSEENRQEMQRIQTSESQKTGYGLGFSVSITDAGVKMVGHGGSVAGYSAYLVFDPDSKIGVILLRNYNRGSTNLGQAAKMLLSQLIASR